MNICTSSFADNVDAIFSILKFIGLFFFKLLDVTKLWATFPNKMFTVHSSFPLFYLKIDNLLLLELSSETLLEPVIFVYYQILDN